MPHRFKTTGSWGDAGWPGTHMAAAAMGGLWARCGSQCHPRKRPTVGAGSSRFSRRFPRPSRPPPRILSRPPFPVVIPAWSCRHYGVCKNHRVSIGTRREDQKTTRHAASLRPSGNGRMGFKPPYSKRGNPSKPRMGSIFIGAFPFLRVERFQSCNLIYRRPDNDAARRVATSSEERENQM